MLSLFRLPRQMPPMIFLWRTGWWGDLGIDIWFAYSISECAVLVLTVILLMKYSERNGIVFKEPQY